MTTALVTRLETDLKAQNTAGRVCKIGLKTVSDDTTPEIARTKRGALRSKRWWWPIHVEVHVTKNVYYINGNGTGN